jgi:hypothetical protein
MCNFAADFANLTTYCHMINSMFNFTPPPHIAFCDIRVTDGTCNASGGAHNRARRLFLYLSVALLLLPACTKIPSYDGRFFFVDTNLYTNRDSLAHYARLAYLEDDPHALCVTGVAAYYFDGDSAAHDTLPLISTDEADIMLLHAASDLGYEGAYKFIYMLDRHNAWRRSLPEIKDFK